MSAPKPSTFTYGPTIPAFPTFGTYPSWLPANDQVSNVDHAEGSDTTLFMMETIGTSTTTPASSRSRAS